MPSNGELRKIVVTEGWEDKDKQAGRRKGDHHRYVLQLADGRMLYTRVSHGPGGIDDPGLLAVVLRDQLQVTEEQFWDCVRHGTRPPRPGSPPTRPERRLDGKLAWNLNKKAGVPLERLAELDQQEALELWLEYVRKRDAAQDPAQGPGVDGG